MAFNTAIFYDVENLLKGYSFSQQMVANLSLREIVKQIKEKTQLDQIAVQRAYANWSDPRLAIMRGEINELGIEPIQVFGFSRDQKKNAADIQLAIDAVDLAHVRPALEVFVIVSGDGGFACLAKQLHEYGKVVIGCAYQSATSKVFEAVCDDFVRIPDPDEEEAQARGGRPSAEASGLVSTAVRNDQQTWSVKPLTAPDPHSALAKAREVIRWYAGRRPSLLQSGIPLSVVGEDMRRAIPGFQSIRLGFPKLIEYMQCVCKGTSMCVARPPGSQPALFCRDFLPTGTEVLPDEEVRDVHSVEVYRSVLATGMPIFRFPEASEFQAVLNWVLQHPPEGVDLGSMIEGTAAGLNGLASTEAVKLALLSLASAGAFVREPEGVSISEQRLTLKADMRNLAALLARLREAARGKLQASLGQVRDDILVEIVPNLA